MALERLSKSWRRWMALAFLALGLVACEEACETANQISDFIDNISDGAPCTEDYECLGGRCLKPAQGYPNGYCTTLQCEQNGCSGFFSECFNAEVEGQAVTACYETCDFDGSCERAGEGYACVVLEDVAVCLPPGTTNAPVQGAIGSACSANAQCNGEGAACLTNFFGGYCTVLGCQGSADCPGGEPCVLLNPDAQEADQVHACMKSCADDDACRFGYACQAQGDAQICLEGERGGPRNPGGAEHGAACVANINCQGGTCIREREGADGGVSYPGGYCTQRDCQEDADCGEGAVCTSRARSTTCMDACQTDADCRTGYACQEGAQGKNFCDSFVEPVVPEDGGTSGGGEALDVTCQASKTLRFSVPQGSQGFFVAPYSKENVKVVPTRLTFPDGSTLDIRRDYSFLAINPELLGSLAPMLFPATDMAPLRSRFVPGDYQLEVQTQAREICYYVLPQAQLGRQLDLHVYLVGVPGVTANSAPADNHMKKLVAVMQRIYREMGVEVRVAKYIDAPKAVVDNYSIIRDFYDIYNLVATSEAPAGGIAGNLVVNVFLINDFNVSEAPGLLGVSSGIPGMAGLHGSSGSGLVFSSASLGRDDAALGQTMAHEIGHFLGLRHTTEHAGSDEDPISDTPTCIYPDLGWICDDATNFMFPFSLGGDQYRATSGQAFVVRRNPLVKP